MYFEIIRQEELNEIFTALPEEQEQRFEKIEREYFSDEILRGLGVSASRKCLLYGPQGCGKKTRSKIMARTLNIPFFSVSLDLSEGRMSPRVFKELLQPLSWIVDSSRALAFLLFIEDSNPYIKFSEGEDIISTEYRENTGIFLKLINDCNPKGVVVASAQTLLRKHFDNDVFNVFEHVIEIPLPRAKEVETILKRHLLGLRFQFQSQFDASGVKWDSAGMSMENARFSAAEVVKVARECQKNAVFGKGQKITQTCVEKAIATIAASRQ